MAENSENNNREDLADEASPYRVEEFRRQGRVAQSKELTGLAALIATGVCVYVMSPMIGEGLVEYMRTVFRVDLAARVNFTDINALKDVLFGCIRVMAALGLPVIVVGFVIGILGSLVQTGPIFSMDPLQPDFSRINPISGLQRFFTLKHLMDGIRVIIKGVVVAFVAYGMVKTEVLKSPRFLLDDPSAMLDAYSSSGRTIFMVLLGVLLVFAGFDFWIQRWEFGKSVRLTKQEAKQEHKEHEGDPLIKARIRSVQREMARKRMMQAVKKADVIITNPTHIAIAIQYEKEKMAAPKVIAKGADFLAQKIKKIAADAGVPLVENVPLARTLFKSVKVGQAIPRNLYQAVAEVLAYVYRLKGRRQG